jgi:hypothetical protein
MSMRPFVRLVPAICLLAFMIPSASLAQKRPAKEIAAELAQASEELGHYDFASHVAPEYAHQMVPELTPKYQKHLQLVVEYMNAVPAQKAAARAIQARDLAILALYKDADAIRQIDTLKQSKTPADAALGKMASLQLAWWSDQKPEAQKKVMEEFKALAKANPMDDALPSCSTSPRPAPRTPMWPNCRVR